MPQEMLVGAAYLHAQEAAILCETRVAHLQLPSGGLLSLGRLDDRLLAHFDGLSTSGDGAQRLLDAQLEDPSQGAVFTFAVGAIEGGNPDALERLSNLAKDIPSVASGLMTAFGWVEPRHLRGVVRDLLKSVDPQRRALGLAACAMHRTDPGLDAGSWLDDPDVAVRARALRTVGELGLRDLEPRCAAAMDDDPDCRFWAMWSSALLGPGPGALEALRRVALEPEAAHRTRAFRLLLQALDPAAAHATLQGLAKDPSQLRWLIFGSGIAGDPAYVPWLIGRMNGPETARVAGEAFTLITGADLDALQLWRQPPEEGGTGPTEDPEDENVDLDPDEGLMWPDQEKVQAWWVAHGSRR